MKPFQIEMPLVYDMTKILTYLIVIAAGASVFYKHVLFQCIALCICKWNECKIDSVVLSATEAIT